MRRLWLIFSQAATVGMALLFVVATLKPQWLSGHGQPFGAVVAEVVSLRTAAPGASAAGAEPHSLAEAMQRYGLICVDTSGDSSVVAEALSGERRWEGLLREDALHGIPIERLRVLRPSAKIPIP